MLIDVISFPVGVLIVTVESPIVVLLIVVGALIVTIGGNFIVVVEEFPARSYTVTVIVWIHSSGSRLSTTGLVAGLIVVSVPLHDPPSSAI